MINCLKIFLTVQLVLRIINVLSYNIIDAAASVAIREYNFNEVTAVCSIELNEDDVSEFITKFGGSVVIYSASSSILLSIGKEIRELQSMQVVLFAKTPKEFAIFASMIRNDIINPIRLLLIMSQAIIETDLTEVTKIAWENDIADIIVLNSYNNKVTLWTFYPYTLDKCGDFTPVRIDVTSTSRYFPDKFQNLYGCPIKITVVEFAPYVTLENENGKWSISGSDGTVAKILFNKMNAVIDIKVSNETVLGSFVNGTGTGGFGDLTSRRSDILLPSILITPNRYAVAQLTPVHETLDVYWCGPARRERHAWLRVLLPFFNNISPFLILSFAVFVIVTKIIRKNALCKPKRNKGIFFQSFVLFLGQAVNFETKCWLVNSLFMLWIWYCMIVRIVYQGQLVDGFQKLILEPPLEDLQTSIKVVEGYGGEEVFRDYLDDKMQKMYQVLDVDDIDNYLREIDNGKRFLLATDVYLVKMMQKPLQILNEPIIRAICCFHLRPGWSAVEKVREIIFRLIETGQTVKIMDDFIYSKAKPVIIEEQITTPLKMSSLSACFFGLLVMYLICFVVLWGEIFYHKYKNNRNELRADIIMHD